MIKPTQSQERRKSCFLGLFIVLAIIVMLCGAVSLIAGLFYSQEVNSVINNYWTSHGGTPNNTQAGNSSGIHSGNHTTLQTNGKNGTSSSENSAEHNVSISTTEEGDWDDGNYTDAGNTTSAGSGEVESGETETEDSTTKKPGKKPALNGGTKPQNHTATTNSILAGLGVDGKVLDDAEDKLAASMIRLERFLENLTVK